MEVSRRCDYACRILRAANKRSEGFVSIAEIAEEESIPYAFARSIQHDLTSAGFIVTARGARGGLALKCDLDQVTMLDVITALQGPASVASCSLDLDSCAQQSTCVFNRVWQGADKILFSYFSSITLGDLFRMGGAHPLVAQAMHLAPHDMDSFLESAAIAGDCAAPLSEAFLGASEACGASCAADKA
ncbi:MAG: Rrf2 family transcriptional regulator [Raoultibacter sp.]